MPGNGLKIVRRFSKTVLENSSILTNIGQSLFYGFSDTVSENLEIAKKGPPLMKKMRLVFFALLYMAMHRRNLPQLLRQSLKSSKKQYRQANL